MAHNKTITKSSANRYSGWYEFSARNLLLYPHCLFPQQNLNSFLPANCELSSWYREPFPYKCSYHLPFLPPNNITNVKIREGDPATSLIAKKMQWQNFLRTVEKRSKTYDYDFTTVDEAISSKLNMMKMSKYESYFLHLLNIDPDPDFNGVTNWWYSGGRVSHMLVGGQMALLTSCGERNEKLCVVPISDESASWQPIISGAMEFPTSTNDTIYQIVCSSKKSGRHNLVGLRQKNACTLISLQLTDDSFEQREDKCWEVKYDKEAFTSLDFNHEKFGKFCTSTVGRLVSIWDAKNSCCISTHVVQKNTENLPSLWCSLQYIDANTIVMSDPSTLMLLDVRLAFDKPSLTFSPGNQSGVMWDCEDISVIFRSSSPSASGRHLYCGTSHHAFLFDARNTQAVQLWTHMLRSPPLYGGSVAMGTTETTELMYIANQDPSDTQLIVNDWYKPDGIPRSAVFPFCAPSLVNSSNFAQTSGQLLDPRAYSRMKLSVTGVSCLPASSTTAHSIITQTSAGDVFVQELRELNRKVTYTKRELKKLKDWEECVLSIKCEPKVKLTAQYESDFIFNALTDPKNKLPRYKKKIRLPESINHSTSELFLYKDFLASKLLQVWDLDTPGPNSHLFENGMPGDANSSALANEASIGLPISTETPENNNHTQNSIGSDSEEVQGKTSEKKRKTIDSDFQKEEITVPKLKQKKEKKKATVDDSQKEDMTVLPRKKKKKKHYSE